MKTKPKLTPYACPECGNTGENGEPLAYTEQAELCQNVLGVSQDGTVIIQSKFYINDSEIIPSGFRCFKCGHYWDDGEQEYDGEREYYKTEEVEGDAV